MAAQGLAVNGAKVYIVGRTERKLKTVVDVYNKDIDGQIIALPGDISDKHGIRYVGMICVLLSAHKGTTDV